MSRVCSIGSLALAALAVVALAPVVADAAPAPTRALQPDDRFYQPRFSGEPAALQQIHDLLQKGQFENAKSIAQMETQPRAVWLTKGSPAEVQRLARQTVDDAAARHEVAVLSLYNIPGRDCGGLSAGGALTTADYESWIQGVARGIGNRKTVVILEPDSLGLLPTTNCGFDPSTGFTDANRFIQLNFAVEALEALPLTSVYLDGTHSHWLATGDIALRIEQADHHCDNGTLSNGGSTCLGPLKAQGLYLNVSNFRATVDSQKYGTWISDCLAFGNNSADGGWRLGHYDYCASQYFSGAAPNDGKPGDSVNPDDVNTWHWSDLWFTQNLGNATPSAHFVVDTSRNGQGPWIPPNPPYPSAGAAQDFCNPPRRGLGTRATAKTGVPLLDAYLWVKVPGESDGTCARNGAPPNSVDPEWGLVDPPAGQWFPQQALQLAQLANPPLN
jgi:endoglucanase